ncbi:MAG: hypothetical protein BM562_06905 [Alphaproteobacteria bacterium MedPE-SWcel]|nr:MAG: hypothetical protein BM562_06905 [Alphaproteobacteria bacterium MedPE-SWcel]
MARRVREEAKTISNNRAEAVNQKNNGSAANALSQAGKRIAAHGTFTKGLDHDREGRVLRDDLEALLSAIDQDGLGDGYKESPFPGVYSGPEMGKPAKFDVPLYKCGFSRPAGMSVRGWESPISGHTFDLQGADSDQLTMPPAPAIGNAELTAEIAEVYAAALVRDLPFEQWDAITGDTQLPDPAAGQVDLRIAMRDSLKALNTLTFFKTGAADAAGEKRRLARFKDGTTLTGANLFRGSTVGAQVGPYISQFLYLGNEAVKSGDLAAEPDIPGPVVSRDGLNRAREFGALEISLKSADDEGKIETTVTEGIIRYGIQGIPQKYPPHRAGVDHMVEWTTWLDVQNGANRKETLDVFEAGGPRFISTPRDLATYVHFDALYQAYLNACLLLLGAQAATDAGFPEGGGNPEREQRDAFATFGGPHVLSLVCEVATRALKAARRQKYNIHLRSRPEALAAAISMAWTGDAANLDALGNQRSDLVGMAGDLQAANELLSKVAAHNSRALEVWTANGWDVDHGPLTEASNALLPMAFPEGSPMHPAYAAGHATVAGACVTVLKAFFEMYETDVTRGFSIYEVLGIGDDKDLYGNSYPDGLFGEERPLTLTHEQFLARDEDGRKAVPFATAVVPDPDSDYTTLKPISETLTIQQELDKLAANISIGRNFAGVHFYTDYYESLRMGERLAVSILQEQMLTYREPVSMRFTSFDGDRIMIVGTGGTRDQDDAVVLVWDDGGNGGTRSDFDAWWSRHAG